MEQLRLGGPRSTGRRSHSFCVFKHRTPRRRMKLQLLQLHNWTHGAICLIPNCSRLGFASNCIKALLTCYPCIFNGGKSASFECRAPSHSNSSFLSWLVWGGGGRALPARQSNHSASHATSCKFRSFRNPKRISCLSMSRENPGSDLKRNTVVQFWRKYE